MKRGQVTIFIVVAIVVIGIVGVLIYLNTNKNQESKSVLETDSVHSFVQLCLDETLKEGVEFVGLQGGYYNEPVLSKYYIFYNIPYYWSAGENKIPEINKIEEEISEYVEDNLDYCLNDFKIFENSYEIKASEINVKSLDVLDNEVQVNIDYPISVQAGEKIVEFKKFDSSVSSDLKKAYDISKQIIEEQKKTPNEIPLGFIAQLASSNDFTFETINVEDDDVVYTLIFGNENNPFIYAYAADYDWEVEGE